MASNYKTTAEQITESTVVTDVSKDIWRVGTQNETPLTTLLGGKTRPDGTGGSKEVPSKIKKESVGSRSFKVVEKDVLSRVVTTTAAVTDTSSTTITVADTANLKPGDIIKNKTTLSLPVDSSAASKTAVGCGSECMYVVSISSSTQFVVRRNLGGTLFQIASGDTFVIVGFGSREGGAKPEVRKALASPREIYLQIFKRAFGLTKSAMETTQATGGIDPESEEMEQALIEHKRDIEFSAWHNPVADTTTDSGSNTVNLSRGIIGQLIANDRVEAYDGGLDEEKFFGQICEKIFEYGSGKKQFFIDSRMMSTFTSWGRVKLQMNPKETTYGINVVDINTGHGTLQLVTCGALGKYIPESSKGFGVVLDIDFLRYKYLNKRDTFYTPSTQTPGDDLVEGLYTTESAIALMNFKAHLVVSPQSV